MAGPARSATITGSYSRNFSDLSEEEISVLEKKRIVGTFDDRPGLKPPIYYNLDEDPIFNYGREGKK